MKQGTFDLLDAHMRAYMTDPVHDPGHIYRVLHVALDIAATESGVDYDVLICACLLHDIGQRAQLADPALCHAQVGSKMAYCFLLEHGFPEAFAAHVRDCISAHRSRKNDPPQSIEAKILFDADKIDVSGAFGIARTLAYMGELGHPLYALLPDGQVSDGTRDDAPTFFREYQYKLKNLYGNFFTARAAEIACSRHAAAAAFYDSMLREVRESHRIGMDLLQHHLESTQFPSPFCAY